MPGPDSGHFSPVTSHLPTSVTSSSRGGPRAGPDTSSTFCSWRPGAEDAHREAAAGQPSSGVPAPCAGCSAWQGHLPPPSWVPAGSFCKNSSLPPSQAHCRVRLPSGEMKVGQVPGCFPGKPLQSTTASRQPAGSLQPEEERGFLLPESDRHHLPVTCPSPAPMLAVTSLSYILWGGGTFLAPRGGEGASACHSPRPGATKTLPLASCFSRPFLGWRCLHVGVCRDLGRVAARPHRTRPEPPSQELGTAGERGLEAVTCGMRRR